MTVSNPKNVSFNSSGFKLEGLITNPAGPDLKKGVIITHPHPLMGGNMHNPVVETIADVYDQIGYTVLRFNFRGTGKSEGNFDDGIGEINDVIEAVSYLKNSGINKIELSGYSFGAWVNICSSARGENFKISSLISPPVDFIKFPDNVNIPELKAVVCGEHDEYCSVKSVESFVNKCNPLINLDIISNTDHFYSACLSKLKSILIKRLKKK